MSFAEVVSAVGASILVGGAAVGAVKMIARDVQRDTSQLRHNGGSHVADYARDARDAAQKIESKLDAYNDRLTHFIIQSAAKDAQQDARLDVLMAERAVTGSRAAP